MPTIPLCHFFQLRAPALAVMTALLAAGCGGGDDSGPQEQAVTIEFAAVAGSAPVSCGAVVASLGSTGVPARVKDFRFYITNVRLLKADGSKVALTLGANDEWNYTSGGQSVTLIDLEDGSGECATQGTAATNNRISGKVPAGTYVGVEMTMGVPFAFNHTDTVGTPAPLDIQAMTWNWQAGRKFAKIEVTDPAGASGTWAAKTFNVHLGSTGCTGNPASGQTVSCLAPNRMEFHFHDFNPATQKIGVDLAALLAGVDVTVNQAGAAGCMSGGTDPECGPVFSALKIDWKPDGTGTGLPIDEGHGQALFKVMAK